MPISPANRHRYPADWPAIRKQILERAGHCCEGSPAYPDCRAKNYEPHPVTGSKVVLTIGHLDHVPEHSEPTNLRAWCQRCHITYDAKRKAAERRARNVGCLRCRRDVKPQEKLWVWICAECRVVLWEKGVL